MMTMDKQVFDLTPSDLEGHAVWYFPMDESVEDELTVRPLAPAASVPAGLQAIVRTDFTDSKARTYPGYVYWGEELDVEYMKPTMWIDNLCVTFWNGIQKPSSTYVEAVRERLGDAAGPVRYQSQAVGGLGATHGELAGLYHLAESGISCIRF